MSCSSLKAFLNSMSNVWFSYKKTNPRIDSGVDA